MAIRKMIIRIALSTTLLGCADYAVSREASERYATTTSAIVGGNDVPDDSPARFVTVGLDSPGIPVCTSVLVAPDLLLTAAHCVEPYDQAQFRDANVEFQATFGGGVKTVESYRMHPGHRDADGKEVVASDIALVKLTQAAPPPYRPSRLLIDDRLKAGMTVLQAGYGSSTDIFGIPLGIGTLRQVENRITELSPGTISVMDNSGERVRAACHGDSGGPLLVNIDGQWLTAGVTSRATMDLGRCTGGNRYVSVVSNRSFLESAARELTGRANPFEASDE
jgi:secreted trypsin-like serine protease